MLKGKSILITGGTGSFGTKAVEHILRNEQPRRLVVFSRDELKQYEMAQSFPEKDWPIRYFIGDVRDRDRLIRACAGVDVIIHAAAMKHISAAEYNPTECVATNVMGGQNVVDAAIANDVEKVLALSTDKAANPINLYGATKLCSDKQFIAANSLAGRHRTRFSVVRYGNVIGSRGSVIPFYRKLVAQGAVRLPLTHPDMTRFVITLDQGVRFVLTAIEVMTGGELFVPKLPSIRIVDLVTELLGKDRYDVTGVRAGEKLHEVMIPLEEMRNTVEFDDHYLIQPAFHWWNIERLKERISSAKAASPVAIPFEYASNTNAWWLTGDELRAMIDSVPAAR